MVPVTYRLYMMSYILSNFFIDPNYLVSSINLVAANIFVIS